MSVVTPAILQLQADWFHLHDLDRARAIAAIRRTGTSLRKIAAGLHFSESLLRHLLWALNACPEDQVLARQNQISINELVRRAKDSTRQREIRSREAEQRNRQKSIRSATDSICRWLITTNFTGPTCERIVEDVRREFAERERDRSLPAHPLLPLPPLPELIRRSKPATPEPDGATSASWYAEWLCRWTFFAYADADIRGTALQLASEKQWTK